MVIQIKHSLIINKMKLTNIPNKGQGYVAERLIKEGELLLNEQIKVITQKNQKSNDQIKLRLIYLILTNIKFKNQFSSLHPDKIEVTDDKTNKIILSIKNIKNVKMKFFFESIDPKDILLCFDKIKKNVFEYSNKLFIAFDGSKFNHSCCPNIDYYYDEVNNTLSFYSNKEINKGEELTISYLKENVSSSNLEYTYGFKCDCEKCKINMFYNR